ncbi:MAG TPA: ROK family protein [Candidatus Fimimorpha faecalis]|mgnify:CR=1 FL=1|uniref:ROK family protein n=1 Tax=Candidatus Fimimorpha faecalis TaxID=2840824 RepID=A0A9D1ED10_9FIRM|nr:ROK family protein [Candidatus Fimimorpha faecalis]
MKQYICIDVGGTSIKYGILEQSGRFLDTSEIPTEAHLGGPAIIEKMKSIIREYLSSYTPDGICVSTAGMVDCEKGSITYAAPLIPNYTGTPIREILENEFHLPSEVENDVNCAGLAEYFSGAGKNSSICLCLTIGTGIGGSIIMNGQILHGFSGSGCEIGYMHLPGGSFQDLGASKTLVEYVTQKKGLLPGTINGKWIFEHAKSGDMDCIHAIDKMVDILGMGIANICYVINPEIVILGGGIMAQKDYLYDKIRKSIDHYLLPTISQHTKLAFAQNQNHAGMLGAYYHFCRRHPELCED